MNFYFICLKLKKKFTPVTYFSIRLTLVNCIKIYVDILHVFIFCLLRNYTTIVDVWLYHIVASVKNCFLQKKSNCVLKKLPGLGSET